MQCSPSWTQISTKLQATDIPTISRRTMKNMFSWEGNFSQGAKASYPGPVLSPRRSQSTHFPWPLLFLLLIPPQRSAVQIYRKCVRTQFWFWRPQLLWPTHRQSILRRRYVSGLVLLVSRTKITKTSRWKCCSTSFHRNVAIPFAFLFWWAIVEEIQWGDHIKVWWWWFNWNSWCERSNWFLCYVSEYSEDTWRIPAVRWVQFDIKHCF